MPTISFQHKVMLANCDGIVLCRAVDAQGRALFHYVQASRKELERIVSRLRKKRAA